MQQYRLAFIALILWCFVLLPGCTKGKNRLEGCFKESNILLISIDTLRADYLGCYGCPRKTPVIDSIAATGFVFESMFTSSSTTFPAHVSLMTSLYPRDCRNGYYLRESVTTLAEVLGKNGYQCMAFVSALPLDKKFNLDQGFNIYNSDFSSCKGSMILADNKWFTHDFQVFDCTAGETNQRVLTALKTEERKTPYFLWVHYFDPHLPYVPPKGYYDPAKVTRTYFPYFYNPSKADLTSLHELYGGEVQFVDTQIEGLLKGLAELGMMDDTIVVLVADHGENLYDHDGYLDHSQVVYDTVMRIPCIIQLPGWKGRHCSNLVSIMDIMPTLLDLVDISYTGNLEGYSLVGLMEKDHQVPVISYVTCETNDFGLKDDEQTIALRTGTMKYIRNNWRQGKDIFFAIDRDPHEKHPIKNADTPEKRQLVAWYREWFKKYKSGNLADPVSLDKKTRDALKGLGYLQ